MIKEVKRRAVLGEKIKLVEFGFETEDCGFEVGKTYKVREMWNGYPRIMSSKGELLYMEDYEYVVLEGEENLLEKFTDSELEAELKRRREQKYFNADVVCINGFSGLTTVGKIYHVVNGSFKWDDGCNSYTYDSLEDMNDSCFSKFIKLVP